MTIASFSADFFEGYTSALRSLENSFFNALALRGVWNSLYK
jgi:hypothetical protein